MTRMRTTDDFLAKISPRNPLYQIIRKIENLPDDALLDLLKGTNTKKWRTWPLNALKTVAEEAHRRGLIA